MNWLKIRKKSVKQFCMVALVMQNPFFLIFDKQAEAGRKFITARQCVKRVIKNQFNVVIHGWPVNQ